jgi:RNA 2',3'-cyclic 3'-phosphodiesterase
VSARLFVALDLPEAVVEALVAWGAPLVGDSRELRAVPPEALHVTLAFLGSKPEEAIPPLSKLVGRCAAVVGGLAGLAFGEPLWLPRRRPRVLAVALEDRHGQLRALQARLVELLAIDGWYEREARPYLPHVTVARVRGSATARARELPAPPELVFDGARLVLYRSHTSPSGARYEALSVSRFA